MSKIALDDSIENLFINNEKFHCSCKVSLSREMLKAIEKSNCRSIAFSYGEWPELSFLLQLSCSITKLIAQSESMDWESIGQLTELKQLTIDGATKDTVDFSNLKKLKSLEYHWDKKNYDSVLSHQGIEHLILYGAKSQDFSVFKGMKSLKKLEIIRGNFTSLDGIDDIPELRSLRLSNITKLENVSALNKLDDLLHIGFSSCNKIKFDQDYSGLKRLRELSMVKQKNIDSLRFVSTLPRLEILKIFEMSVKDGDFEFLFDMSFLKALRVDRKKHYNVDVKKFSKSLRNKHGEFELDFYDILDVDDF